MVRWAVALLVGLSGPAGACPGEAATRFPQAVAVGALIGLTVEQPLESHAVLGTVRGVAREADGCVVAILEHGGLLARFGGVWGIGSRRIAVPLGAMTLVGRAMQVVDLTPSALDALPSYGGGSSELGGREVVRVGLSGPAH